MFSLRPGLRTESWRYVVFHHRRRSAADWRDHRLDLLWSGAFASGLGRDVAGRPGGAAVLDDAQPLGRGHRAALLVASVLAGPGGSHPAASCDRPSGVRPRVTSRPDQPQHGDFVTPESGQPQCGVEREPGRTVGRESWRRERRRTPRGPRRWDVHPTGPAMSDGPGREVH